MVPFVTEKNVILCSYFLLKSKESVNRYRKLFPYTVYMYIWKTAKLSNKIIKFSTLLYQYSITQMAAFPVNDPYNVLWCVTCWFELMEDTGADFTMTFRQLSEVTLSQLQKGSIAPVHFLSIHTHSSCNIHNHDFSPLTVTVSLLTVSVGSFRPLITWLFQRLGSAVCTASAKVMLQ